MKFPPLASLGFDFGIHTGQPPAQVVAVQYEVRVFQALLAAMGAGGQRAQTKSITLLRIGGQEQCCSDSRKVFGSRRLHGLNR